MQPKYLPLPDIDSLRCFVVAAEQRNFSIAARKVGLSSPAFSERIQKLEDFFGQVLFLRSTRQVALSEAGQRLLPQALLCLEEATRCQNVLAEQDAPYSLTLGTRYELGLSWLLPGLEQLEAQHPERNLNLYFGDTPDLFRALKEGHIDALISSARLAGSAFDYITLHPEHYVFVGHRRLAPLQYAAQAPAHTLLDISPDLPLFRYLLDALNDPSPWNFKRTQYLGTIGAIRARVLDGAGVAVLPAYFVEGFSELQVFLPSQKLRQDAFRLVWPRGDVHTRVLRVLGEELRLIPIK